MLTFDQPLYWKATEIQEHEKYSTVKDIVLILGSFHILMSYLGSIGHLMSGTGLHSVLEQVYADKTVPHMLSGKAVSRARRGHLLVACALEGLKVSQIYEIDLSTVDEDEDEMEISKRFMENEELKELVNLSEKIVSHETDVDQLSNDEVFKGLLTKKRNVDEKT